MTHCFFVSDIHGQRERYEKLWQAIEATIPDAVFLGGDLRPSGLLRVASTPRLLLILSATIWRPDSTGSDPGSERGIHRSSSSWVTTTAGLKNQ